MKRMITYFSSTVLMTATLLATGCSASGVLNATPPVPQRIPASAKPTIAEAKKTATKQTEDQQNTQIRTYLQPEQPNYASDMSAPAEKSYASDMDASAEKTYAPDMSSAEQKSYASDMDASAEKTYTPDMSTAEEPQPMATNPPVFENRGEFDIVVDPAPVQWGQKRD
jgi:hypothetical protein